ncbi:MAG: uroporphyrinogen-III synthase [Nitrospinota bacterium]
MLEDWEKAASWFLADRGKAVEAKETAGFNGLRVAAFESRMADQMGRLIARHGGEPLVAPSMREVPLEENAEAFSFAEGLFSGRIDLVVFLTGVGTRTLAECLLTRYPGERIVEALSSVNVVARGPKPVKALRDLGVPITLTIPEPNTWREILQSLDASEAIGSLRGAAVAVQEYGVPNQSFLKGLEERGARVIRVPVYRWTLPEDTAPLRNALRTIVEGKVGVALFTNAQQIDHVLHVAAQEGVETSLRDAFRNLVVASVGPTCTEALLARGFSVDVEPRRPKMGILVEEAAARSRELLERKRAPGGGP